MANVYTLSLQAQVQTATLEAQLKAWSTGYTLQLNAAIQQIQQAASSQYGVAGGQIGPAPAPTAGGDTSATDAQTASTQKLTVASKESQAAFEQQSEALTDLNAKITTTTDSEGNITAASKESQAAFKQQSEALTDLNAKITTTTDSEGNITAVVGKYTNEAGNAVTETTKYSNALGEVATTSKEATGETQSFGGAIETIGGNIANSITKMALWAIAAEVIFGSLRKIGDGVQYVKDLDIELTQVKIITGETSQEVNNLGIQYNQLAQSLGSTTIEVTQAAEAFLKQGKSVQDTNELLKTTIELSDLSGQSAADSASSLTGIMNTFNLSADQASKVLDTMVVASTKTDVSLGALSDSLSKSSEIAAASGMSFNQLTSYIVDVANKTQKPIDTVSQNLANMLSRMQEVAAGKSLDDFSQPINNVEKTLNSFGISLRDTTQNFLPMGDVLDSIAKKWETYDTTTQKQIATQLGGIKNYQTVLALMDSYNQALSLQAQMADGANTTNEKMAVYLNSDGSAAKTAQSAWEALWSATINSQGIAFIENLSTDLAHLLLQIGGLGQLLINIFPMLRLFQESLQIFTNGTLSSDIQKTFNVSGYGAEWAALGKVINDLFSSPNKTDSPIKSLNVDMSDLRNNIGAVTGSSGIPLLTGDYDTLAKSVNDVASEYNDLNSALLKQKSGSLTSDDIEKLVAAHSDLAQFVKVEGDSVTLNTDAVKKYIEQKIIEEQKTLAAAQATLLDAEAKGLASAITEQQIEDLKGEIVQLQIAAAGFDSLGNAATTLSDVTSGFQTLQNAIDESNKTGQISIQTAESLITAGYAQAVSVNAQTGALSINYQALKDVAVEKANEAVQNAWTAYMNAGTTATETQTAALLKNWQAAKMVADELASAPATPALFGGLDIGSSSGSGGGETAAQKMKTLTDMVVSMIREQKDAQKQALQDELASYKTFIDAQKQALDDQKTALDDETTAYSNIISAQKTELQLMHDKQNYQDTLAQNEKDIANTQMQLDALALDNSEEAKAKRLTLQDTLAEQTTTINKTQSDEQYNNQQTALDNELTAFKANQQDKLDMIATEQTALDGELQSYTDNVNAQTKLIDDYLSKSGQMAQDALQMVHDKGSSLYQDLIKWNSVYGTGITADVTSAWDGATGAVQAYGSAVNAVNNSTQQAIKNQISATGSTNDPNAVGTTYSKGGLVTGGTPGQDSVSAKLMPGEYVLTTAQVNSIGLPNLTNRGIPSTTSNSGNGGNQISMPITVQGNLDKSVLPDLEAMITKTIGKLNSTMLSRGYKRNVSAYSS